MINHGCLVISLDLEMMWGCHDWSTVSGYGKSNVSNVRLVVDRLLDLFDTYDVHATFACVGLLFLENSQSAIRTIPTRTPSYSDRNKSPYKNSYIENIRNEDSDLYFAPDIIKKLIQHPNIEVASHTFSHYFCWERGQCTAEFEADVQKMNEIADRWGIEMKSIVLPKNQISNEYLHKLSEYGLKSYRGNPTHYFSKSSNKFEALVNSACRFLDTYLCINKKTAIPYERLKKSAPLMDIAASRFIRPYSSMLSILEKLRLNRIKQEMKHAAINSEMYHIWWHPHNFGTNIEENLSFMQEILKFYKQCHEEYGMQSYTMDEMANVINHNKENEK
ncbi:MAG: polysaccharide deacetylase family protein [Rikenellaceae bacterium]